MFDADRDWALFAQVYPGIVEAGDTGRAWQAEFDRLGAPVEVCQRQGLNWYRYAFVGTEDGDARHARVGARPDRRRLHLVLFAGKPVILHGFAPDLAIAAGATRLWLDGSRAGDVAAAWPFLGSVALAEARERGDLREAAWLDMYENHADHPIKTPLQPFVALAFHEPRLRALRPFTSHSTLCFSRTERFPFDVDRPTVEPAKAAGRFVVRTRDGRVFDETDAAGALRTVLTELEPLGL